MIQRIHFLAVNLVLAGSAVAQTYQAADPKLVGGEQSILWEWLFGLVFVIGCLVVAFKPAKRSNLE